MRAIPSPMRHDGADFVDGDASLVVLDLLADKFA